MPYNVRFVNPARNYQMLKEELDAAYLSVMSRGDLVDRQDLKQFERNLADFVGTKYAVGLNSGYDALHLSLRAAGIGPGDEVIVIGYDLGMNTDGKRDRADAAALQICEALR